MTQFVDQVTQGRFFLLDVLAEVSRFGPANLHCLVPQHRFQESEQVRPLL
jgi:hypothetical protein